MDAQVIQQVIDWVQNNVGDRTTKEELMMKAERANLPGEGKSALDQLRPGEHSKSDVIESLKDRMMAGVGSGFGSGGSGGSGGGSGGLGGVFGR